MLSFVHVHAENNPIISSTLSQYKVVYIDRYVVYIRNSEIVIIVHHVMYILAVSNKDPLVNSSAIRKLDLQCSYETTVITGAFVNYVHLWHDCLSLKIQNMSCSICIFFFHLIKILANLHHRKFSLDNSDTRSQMDNSANPNNIPLTTHHISLMMTSINIAILETDWFKTRVYVIASEMKQTNMQIITKSRHLVKQLLYRGGVAVLLFVSIIVRHFSTAHL